MKSTILYHILITQALQALSSGQVLSQEQDERTLNEMNAAAAGGVQETNKEQVTSTTDSFLLSAILDRNLLDLTPCGEVLATIPQQSIQSEFNDLVEAVYPPGGESAVSLQSVFADKMNYGVKVMKVCASCQEIESNSAVDLSFLHDDSNKLEEYRKYCGSDVYGYDTLHSGLAFFPLDREMDPASQGTVMLNGTLPGFFHNHPTKVSRFNAPSESYIERKNNDIIFGFIATMANGFVSIQPDYMGYGSSTSFRNYIVRDPYVTASMPLWLKVSAYIQEETDYATALADAAFYMGYSEGGYASVVIADGLKHSLGVEPLLVQAGAVPSRHIGGTNLIGGVLANDFNLIPERFTYVPVLFGAALSPANPAVADKLDGQTLLNPAVMNETDMESNVIAWLEESDIDRVEVSRRLVDLSLDNLDKLWNPVINDIARFAFATGGGFSANICGEDRIVVGVTDKICAVMAENDLIETLETAEYPIEICHGTDDSLSAYANVPDGDKNPFLTVITLEGLDHAGAGEVCLGGRGVAFLAEYDPSMYTFEDKHGKPTPVPCSSKSSDSTTKSGKSTKTGKKSNSATKSSKQGANNKKNKALSKSWEYDRA